MAGRAGKTGTKAGTVGRAKFRVFRQLLAVGGAVMVLGILAVPAGAQEVPPPAEACTFSVTPTSVQEGTDPIVVRIDGKAPDGVLVRVFVEGNQVAEGPATGGVFSFLVELGSPNDVISVNYVTSAGNGYATGCQGGIIDPGGISVGGISVGGTSVGGISVAGARASQGLAFTGSSNTLTHVLIAAAAILFGAVLVVASRRRVRVEA